MHGTSPLVGDRPDNGQLELEIGAAFLRQSSGHLRWQRWLGTLPPPEHEHVIAPSPDDLQPDRKAVVEPARHGRGRLVGQTERRGWETLEDVLPWRGQTLRAAPDPIRGQMRCHW